MSEPDNRREVYTRARRLIAAQGTPILSTITGEVTGRFRRVGGFYMRVRVDGELYINDMSTAVGPTVFSQREIDSTGAFHDYGVEDRLLSALRQATVLEDLADV